MRIFVLYDDGGVIRGTMATRLADTAVRPAGGLNVHEFEREEIGPEELQRYLRALHSGSRIYVGPSGPVRLVEKSTSQPDQDEPVSGDKRDV